MSAPFPRCAWPGCRELAVAKDREGRPLCRAHWRMALRSRALNTIAPRNGESRKETTMQFSADLSGLAAKDKAEGKSIELRLVAQFDEGIFAELGGYFGDRIHVQINHPQAELDFAREESLQPELGEET